MTNYETVYNHDEWLRISHNMREYGGSFAKCLADAMIVADGHNRDRIFMAFPEMLEKYAAPHWDSPSHVHPDY
jgi:hypothetical protein